MAMTTNKVSNDSHTGIVVWPPVLKAGDLSTGPHVVT